MKALLAIIVGIVFVVAPQAATAQSDRLSELAPTAIAGIPTTRVSAGAEDVGASYQRLVSGMLEYFDSQLSVETELVVSVLNEADWSVAASGVPYGLPWGTGMGIVLPADSDRGPVAGMFEALLGPEAARVQLENVALHEAGHIVAYPLLGTEYMPRWFGELFASYLGYSYAKSMLDGHAETSEQLVPRSSEP